MKRAKKLYALLGVLVVICVITFAVSKYEEEKEIIKNSDEIILTLDAESVNKLSWEYAETSLSFHKDEGWFYDDDEAFPVDEEKIHELLNVFGEFGVSFIIEEVQDYSAYGLDDPECTIQIETEEETYEILLGDFSTMDSERYVSIGDGNVYLVSNDPMATYEIKLEDMILHDELPNFETVTEVAFTGAEEYEIFYEEESTATYCEDDVYFTEQGGNVVPLDTDNVDSYLGTISSLGLEEYASYNVSDEELESFGLDNPELTVTVQHAWEDAETEEEVEDTFVLHVSRDPEEAAKAAEEAAKAKETEEEDTESEEEEEITAYARVGESQIVYKLDGDAYRTLMAASCNDLRHQEVLSADFADIYQIDISLEGNTYIITSEEEDDTKVYYYGEEELDIYDLKSSLNTMYAEEFTDEKAKDKEEIAVTVYLENDNFPQVELQFYRYDGEHCLAVVDGEPVCLVLRSAVVDVIEAVNAIVLN